jgi:excisionase family DNA binding protein
MQADEFLTPRETASLLRISESFLAKRRLDGSGPPFVKMGRAVRFRRSDVESWADAKLRKSTSDDGQK